MSSYPTLSPSALKNWQEEPALFVLKYLYYTRGESSNIYAIRGIAVESGINKNVLECPQRNDVSIALPEALKSFEEQVEKYNISSEIVRKFKPTITPYVTNGIVQLSNLFNGLSNIRSQLGVCFKFNGINMRGYIDYCNDDIIVDLKCVNRLPSVVTKGPRKGFIIGDRSKDAMQVSIYRYALGVPATLMYICGSEHLIHEVSDAEYEDAMLSVLKITDDIKTSLDLPLQELLSLTKPRNFGSMFWDDELIKHAQYIWREYL